MFCPAPSFPEGDIFLRTVQLQIPSEFCRHSFPPIKEIPLICWVLPKHCNIPVDHEGLKKRGPPSKIVMNNYNIVPLLQPACPNLFATYETLIQSYSQMMISVFNHLFSKVFRFHCHSQKVIGSLGKTTCKTSTFPPFLRCVPSPSPGAKLPYEAW